MATGLLTPDARLRIVTDLGVVAPGALLHTYVSGSPSTPLATYSDSALTVPNANPVVASAGGLFGPIYLTKGTAYKLVLTDASGGAIWDVDPVSVPADNTLAAGTGISLATAAGVTTITATAVASVDVNDFRLTLESGVPVSTTDQLAKTTLYLTPSGCGNRIALYDAAGLPTTLTSAQVSIALPATTSQLYSVFAYNTGGVVTLELTAWTNDTTPGAAAFSIASNGVYTKTGDLTRRYLGVVRTTTVAGQTESSLAKRLLINYYNCEPLPLRVTEATDSWGYNTATYRQANGAPANQVALLVGVARKPVDLRVFASAQNSGGGNVYVSIGEDSTTTPAAGTLGQSTAAGNAVAYAMATAQLVKYPAPGYHYYAWLERNSGGTGTWFGDNGDATLTQSGLHGTVWG